MTARVGTPIYQMYHPELGQSVARDVGAGVLDPDWDIQPGAHVADNRNFLWSRWRREFAGPLLMADADISWGPGTIEPMLALLTPETPIVFVDIPLETTSTSAFWITDAGCGVAGPLEEPTRVDFGATALMLFHPALPDRLPWAPFERRKIAGALVAEDRSFAQTCFEREIPMLGVPGLPVRHFKTRPISGGWR